MISPTKYPLGKERCQCCRIIQSVHLNKRESALVMNTREWIENPQENGHFVIWKSLKIMSLRLGWFILPQLRSQRKELKIALDCSINIRFRLSTCIFLHVGYFLMAHAPSALSLSRSFFSFASINVFFKAVKRVGGSRNVAMELFSYG